jgi:hypothetical protein
VVINDSQGNMHVQQRDAFGNVVGSRPLQASAPAAPGPFTLPGRRDEANPCRTCRASAPQPTRRRTPPRRCTTSTAPSSPR